MTTKQTYRHIKLLGIIDNTLYLFYEEHKILLPIKIGKVPTVYKGWHEPNIYNTTRRILNLLNVEPKNIKIYQENNDEYYAYLELSASKRLYDIHIKLEDALMVTDMATPILVSESVLGEHGIKVTKKMIEDAINA